LAQRLSTAAIEALLADYATGLSSREVADRHSLSKQSVLKLLRQHQVVRPRARVSDHQLVDVVRLRESGMTIRDIGAKVELPPTTVFRALHKAASSTRLPN
jgi:DNA-directed RNA polymerase specialized sigma24 family protein